MSGTEHELERIVREVLRRLREQEITREIRAESAGIKERPGTLSLDDRVITLATLSDKLADVKRIIVPRSAVVTPAVRDELKKRKISLEFATNRPGAKTTSRRLLLAVTTQYDAAALAKRLLATGTHIEQLSATDWKDAVGTMTQKLKDTQLTGVILTDRPAAVACHANRDSAIRAAVVSDARSMKDATDSLGANLLVVDPAAHSLYMLERLLHEYAKSDHRELPL